MRLLKIGRSANCDIVLHSDRVSSVHAEMTLLNNGDITLEDKGSSNGTFIMNQRIEPGKPVSVRPGDAIRFADVELQWSQVPKPEDNSQYVGVYGIGSHFNNDFQVSGATVSRYHATIKKAKDGKMYLIDHSKNGTTVNGTKIPSNSPYRIKKNSVVVCGGVPVDLSRLPWPSSMWRYVVGIAASLIIIFGIGFGAMKLFSKKDKVFDTEAINERYSSSVVYLIGQYHYEVDAGGFPLEDLEKMGLPTKFAFDESVGFIVNGKLTYEGTGFFVSEDGQVITNLHLAKPWLFDKNLEMVENFYRRCFAQRAETQAIVNALSGTYPQGLSAYTSQIKIKGVSDGILLIPQGNFFSKENAVNCKIISAGNDIKKDVALIQSEKMELPNKKTTYVNIKDSMDVSDNALKVGKNIFTIGFPHGITLQDQKSEKGIQVFCHMGHISQVSEQYAFRFDAVSAGGASGSPVFNENGMLIGVLHAGIEKENFTEAIKAQYIKELIENPHENNEE